MATKVKRLRAKPRRKRDVKTKPMDARALLAAIVATSQDAIISKDLNGIITSWNKGAEHLFGYTSDEIIGRSVLVLIPKNRHSEEPVIIERIRRGERIEHFETVRRHKNGALVDISLTVSPVVDSRGRVVGASKIARDISERKRAEILLREEAQRKDEFLATLAHELRNPLAPIRNGVYILKKSGMAETQSKVFETLERQVNHMVRLVDDLLELSRITRGVIELRMERVELAKILHNAVETSRPSIERSGHQFSLSIPSEVLYLKGDEVRLTQVFTNLLNNAAKFTEPGGTLSLEARRSGNEAVVTVRDTGVGIEPEKLSRVFEMFSQFHVSQTQTGLGIGLHLVRNLLDMHSGSVKAHSKGLGHGSEFVVRLPLSDSK